MHAKKLVTLAAVIIILAAVPGCALAGSAWEIQNPYDGVDWTRQYKANFHTHTTMSDGTASPDAVIDAYAGLGYRILALTDHDTMGQGRDRNDPERSRTTWPWQRWDRDPDQVGMVAVHGNEISRVHHIGSYFIDYGDAAVDSAETAIEEIGRRGGLAVLFHPGRYDRPVEWYVEMYRTHSHLVGIEIYNQGDRYPGDRATWDAIQAELGAERPVWAYSNDDMHVPRRHLGRNWNVMLIDELTEASVRRAMKDGTFYYVYHPGGHDGPPAPVIDSISVDPRRAVIRIEATGHERIDWISNGAVVHQGDQVELEDVSELGATIRAELHGADSDAVAGTQPFGLSPPER